MMKKAIVKPLLKKNGLDPELFKNFRPVSNLSFISKIIEKIVASRLVKHIQDNKLNEVLQSAYRTHHSTETALTRVHSDLLNALDGRKTAVLLLLDLSAAFDTIDHRTILKRLCHSFGVRNTALQWFESYLSDRSQVVSIADMLSSVASLTFGVPQGSVLGPILFTLYTVPLGEIARNHDTHVHFYADDTQLYATFDATNHVEVARAVSKLELCVSDMKQWMNNNKLKLNDDKTEVLVISSRYGSKGTPNPDVNIGGTTISPKASARNLGGIFDSHLDMRAHVNKICSASYYHLKNLA